MSLRVTRRCLAAASVLVLVPAMFQIWERLGEIRPTANPEEVGMSFLRALVRRIRLATTAAIVVAACAVIAALAPSAEAEVTPMQDRIPMGEGTFDALNPCNGESIALFGTTFLYQYGVFRTDDGFLAGGSQLVTTATGTGVDSGIEYTLRLRSATANHAFPSSGGIFTQRQHLVSEGAAENFFLVITTIVISDPSGQTRVSYLVEDSGCVG